MIVDFTSFLILVIQ